MKNFLIILFIIIILGSCYTYPVSPPNRVKGIPENAFWVGGVDGGSWYIIQKIDSIKQTALFKIYFDTDGEIWINKELKLHCVTSKSINWRNLKDEIIAFDGNRVLLHKTDNKGNGCYFE